MYIAQIFFTANETYFCFKKLFLNNIPSIFFKIKQAQFIYNYFIYKQILYWCIKFAHLCGTNIKCILKLGIDFIAPFTCKLFLRYVQEKTLLCSWVGAYWLILSIKDLTKWNVKIVVLKDILTMHLSWNKSCKYSQTCLQRPPLGPQKSGCCSKVEA